MEKECVNLLDTLWYNALYLGCGVIVGIWLMRGKPKI
jgi:hypothetical protein